MNYMSRKHHFAQSLNKTNPKRCESHQHHKKPQYIISGLRMKSMTFLAGFKTANHLRLIHGLYSTESRKLISISFIMTLVMSYNCRQFTV